MSQQKHNKDSPFRRRRVASPAERAEIIRGARQFTVPRRLILSFDARMAHPGWFDRPRRGPRTTRRITPSAPLNTGDVAMTGGRAHAWARPVRGEVPTSDLRRNLQGNSPESATRRAYQQDRSTALPHGMDRASPGAPRCHGRGLCPVHRKTFSRGSRPQQRDIIASFVMYLVPQPHCRGIRRPISEGGNRPRGLLQM